MSSKKATFATREEKVLGLLLQKILVLDPRISCHYLCLSKG